MSNQPALSGPQTFNRAERLARAEEITRRVREHLGEQARAAAWYGSLARGADGPYSDVEMFFIVAGEGIDHSLEWSTGPWKAEVNLQSEDMLLEEAREFDDMWPVMHGKSVHNIAIFDPDGLLPLARQAVYDHADEAFEELLKEIIIGDLYEVVGKVRNGLVQSTPELILPYAFKAAHYGASLAGIANRRIYNSGSTVLSESLSLPNLPNGYAGLVELLLSGTLNNLTTVGAAVNRMWEGVESWANQRGIALYDELDDLLASEEEQE